MSLLETILAQEIEDAGLPAPTREYQFHPTRRWRFDLAWPERKVAVEIEGGVWSKGRHTRSKGFIGDCEKYNEAALLGWLVLRVPGDWVKSRTALDYVKRLVTLEKQHTYWHAVSCNGGVAIRERNGITGVNRVPIT
jgi:hypothetical protein